MDLLKSSLVSPSSTSSNDSHNSHVGQYKKKGNPNWKESYKLRCKKRLSNYRAQIVDSRRENLNRDEDFKLSGPNEEKRDDFVADLMLSEWKLLTHEHKDLPDASAFIHLSSHPSTSLQFSKDTNYKIQTNKPTECEDVYSLLDFLNMWEEIQNELKSAEIYVNEFLQLEKFENDMVCDAVERLYVN